MSTLTQTATELAENMQTTPKPFSRGTKLGINVFLMSLTTLTHCLGVKVRNSQRLATDHSHNSVLREVRASGDVVQASSYSPRVCFDACCECRR